MLCLALARLQRCSNGDPAARHFKHEPLMQPPRISSSWCSNNLNFSMSAVWLRATMCRTHRTGSCGPENRPLVLVQCNERLACHQDTRPERSKCHPLRLYSCKRVNHNLFMSDNEDFVIQPFDTVCLTVELLVFFLGSLSPNTQCKRCNQIICSHLLSVFYIRLHVRVL